MKIKLLLLTAIFLVPISVPVFALQSESIMNTIKLPPPDTTGSVTLEQALRHRRSVLDFKPTALRLEQLSQLLWAAQGITDSNTGQRSAPSAGEIYPMTLYVALPDGLYSYNPRQHSLTLKIARDIRPMLYTASYRQEVFRIAPCVIIITGRPREVEIRYRNRGLSFITLEAGHIAQNILLQSVTLGLGSVPVGAFDSKTVKRICKLDKLEEPLYLVCLGEPVKAQPSLSRVNASPLLPVQKSSQSFKAVIIVAPERFDDRELFDTQDLLEIAGVETVLASSKQDGVVGQRRNYVSIDLLISDIDVSDYDAFIFIGGGGSRVYFDDAAVLNIVRNANNRGKILAAIGIAPAILAGAGVVDGKNIASQSSQRKDIARAGGNWQSDLEIVTDGNIVTARDYESSGRFARAILSALRRMRKTN